MAIAFLNAACWSFITPPFQVPDEPSHFAYTQQLAEAGQLPSSASIRFSPEELTALQDLGQEELHLEPRHQSLSTEAQQLQLERDLSAELNRENGGSAGVAASEPPLYYALEAIPYGIASGGTLLDRLELMRLLSALMAGVTALFAFLFVRETLPGVRWAWTVGGLGVACAPLLGFMSGAVNPDAMLYAISAVLLYCLARGFHRGITRRLAITTGAVIAIGLLTKLNFIGLAPGACLGLVLLTRRAASRSGRRAYGWLALALGIGASPVLAYACVNLLSNRLTLGIVTNASHLVSHHGSIFGAVSYIWEFYLPRLPGMPHDFAHYLTTRNIWFNGYVGLYGWFDTTFPTWVYDLALVPAAIIFAAFVRAALGGRSLLRTRLAEVLTYAAMGFGLMLLVGVDSYLKFPPSAAEYGQTRYFLPLLPLLAVVYALAARGVGRRWGPAFGVSLVVLLFAHDIFSQLQTIARYYG